MSGIGHGRREFGIRADEALRRRCAEAEKELRAQFGDDDAIQGEADCREILATPAGRRFVMMLLARTRVFGSVFAECRGRDDLVYQTGRREFGCEVYALVNRCAPDRMREAFDERNAVMAERRRRIADAVKRIEIEEGVPPSEAAADARANEALSLTNKGDQT